MAATVNSSNEAYGVGNDTTSNTQAFTVPSLTNGALVLQVELRTAAARNITGVNMGATPMGLLHYTPATGYHMALAWLSAPASGSQTFEIVTDSAVTSTETIGWKIVYGEGMHQTQASLKDSQDATATGSTDPAIGPFTPSVDGCLVIAAYFSESNNVLTIGAWGTELQNHDYGPRVSGIGYVVQTTAAAVTPDWSGIDDTWVGIAGAFAPADGGAPATGTIRPASRTLMGVGR